MSRTDNKAFDNWRQNAVRMNFPNGNTISTIWGPGSITDDGMDMLGILAFDNLISNDQVEVMIDCGGRLHRRLDRKFSGDGQVIGHLNMTNWLYILNAVAHEAKGGE